mmetsp:Transcript_13726/g.27226  ORF Transcript_13726/g.27226 Transcript_13726/m.27226 type:complete len:228 (-) Transcript_13726:134-817(-)
MPSRRFIVEHVGLREVLGDALAVLRVLVDEALRSAPHHPTRVRLHLHVEHLVSRPLQAEQEKGNLPQRRLHPVPSPRPDLKRGLEVLRVGDVGGDEVFVEPHGGVDVEAQGDAREPAPQGQGHPRVVRQAVEPVRSAVRHRHLFNFCSGVEVAAAVGSHHLADHSLFTRPEVASKRCGHQNGVAEFMVLAWQCLCSFEGRLSELEVVVWRHFCTEEAHRPSVVSLSP